MTSKNSYTLYYEILSAKNRKHRTTRMLKKLNIIVKDDINDL